MHVDSCNKSFEYTLGGQTLEVVTEVLGVLRSRDF